MSYISKKEEEEKEMSTAFVQKEDPESLEVTQNDNDINNGDEYELQGEVAPHSPSLSSSSDVIISNILKGLFSASPTLLLLHLGCSPSIKNLIIYIFLLWTSAIPAWYFRDSEHGFVRWIVGFIFLIIMSGFKSGVLLASTSSSDENDDENANADNMIVKSVIYAITALWECSNAVVILGGSKLLCERYGVNNLSKAFLYASAPSQVRFYSNNNHNMNNNNSINISSSRNRRRSLHIAMCFIGLGFIYYILDTFAALRNIIVSHHKTILLEVECLAIMSSLAVVLLDIPSHLWQCFYDLLKKTLPFSSSSSPQCQIVLPYGWVYSSTSTREFWSRWSRPASQVVRHLFYYPLGGKRRWYWSIPIMFLLNASTHYDVSNAIVGDRAEVWWNSLFGVLAGVAMLEVVGDKFFLDGNDTSDGQWYKWVKFILVHISLRVVGTTDSKTHTNTRIRLCVSSWLIGYEPFTSYRVGFTVGVNPPEEIPSPFTCSSVSTSTSHKFVHDLYCSNH